MRTRNLEAGEQGERTGGEGRAIVVSVDPETKRTAAGNYCPSGFIRRK